jgi:ubiquinone/menaquinone biosynthesis C-methylase UbiE
MVYLIRTVGWRRLLELFRAYRLGWQGIISGFYTTRTLQVLFNVGFFDEILAQGQVEVRVFAEQEHLDEKILQSLCDSLYALRILDRRGDAYVLTGKGLSLAKVARGWFVGTDGYRDVFHSIEAMLHKEKCYGRNVDRRLLQVLRGTSEISSWIHFPLALYLLQQMKCQRVLDLGCGDGSFLHYLYEQGGIRGYGIDMAPDVVDHGNEQFEEAGIGQAVQLFPANLTDLGHVATLIPKPDAATALFVLHEVLYPNVDVVVQALEEFRRLFPGVPLIVFEVDLPTMDDMRKRPGMIVQYMVQHDLTNQKLAGRMEWQELFHRAGFKISNKVQLSAGRVSVFVLG